ncbi:MAG: stage II sporulation protein M [archaeon]|nr:stage II sporulation protein M [archaeon]MCR4323968.1 stage II sporulation protein M [Nanoarchaeota archaeon]
MIEMLIRPRRAERRPWEMFFVGLFYASVSFLLVSLVFGKDSILKQGSGMLIVIFTVICCLPFMYYIIKLEERKDVEINESGKLIKEHYRAISALMWLFFGFVVAFSFWYIVMPDYAGQSFNFQIKTFCAINSATNYDYCLEEHGVVPLVTGGATSGTAVMGIFANNIYVLIFTILFSLALGAGAIFILVWNATVISAAIGIFAKESLSGLPIGILRYIIHGIPEIGAYFVGALAGGIVSVAVIRKDLRGEGLWRILQDALFMIIIAIMILIVAALMEVYLTPLFF